MASTTATHGSETLTPNESPIPSAAISIGTRKSNLALAQTHLVVSAFATACPNHVFEIKARDTAAGDIDKVTPFKDMAVKNIWTHELEMLMREKKLDILVHSLKDVPTLLPPNCEISGVLERADPRDVLVVKAGRKSCGIADLPAGSVIGTSSIRRTAQIALRYPHLKVHDLRGNINTRVNKLDAEDGPYDAIILAAAGLLRTDMGGRISQYLDAKSANMLYAVGQGAIGIENRSDDATIKGLVSKINHMQTFLAITAERSLLRFLEGGCSAPLGVETEWVGGESESATLRMQANVVSVDGTECAEVDMKSQIRTVAEAEEFGVTTAQELVKHGAGKILAEIQAKKRTTTADLEET